MVRLILLGVSLSLSVTAAWSQTTPDTGSSVIRGRVIATATGRGIRGATVNVTAPELPRARTATTDADGRYELKDLPSGRYTVTAGKPTFITLQRGQTRPFEAAKPLVLGDKETIVSVDFSLPRGGVITGRVVDELGDPVVNVTVRAMRMRYVPGGRDDLRSVGTAVPTNDLGVFRIFGLSPGQYYVFASLRYALGTDPAGSALAASYFPGVTTFEQAQRVTVALGQTAIADLTLTPVKTGTLTGRVVDADGRPISAGFFNLIQRPPAPTEGIGFMQLRPDGTFRVSNVPAGEYQLDFDVSEVNFATARPGQASRAAVRLAPDGSDVSDLVVSLPRMSGGVGRLILPAGAPPLNPSAVRLSPVPTDPYENRWYAGEATVKEDLSFDFTSPPGQMALRPAAIPRGWALKEVRHEGKVVTDTGLKLAPGEKAKDIEVELTNQPPIISGTVRGVKGEPADDYAVVLFAQDVELRRNSARHFAVVRPDQSGQFRLDTLPPGEYFAVALDYVDPNEAGNPDLLRRLEPAATRFEVREGQTQSLALRIVAP